MKKLTKLLLINWHYFQNTVIDFGTINFLTGKNSAGKSTIIDALQVVLMGETRSSAFNRAASKKSERTLKSYLVGSMGEDVENGKKSLREGKDFSTYIVAEFYDDFKSEYFCLGAIFDSFSDGGDFNKRFFYLRSTIPDCRFIENGKTMDSRRATQYFKENHPNKYETKDTSEAYRSIVLTRLNIHDAKFISMLKKAISFEPINDIEKFITENVCDIEDDIDITAMQENIMYYKQQEVIARRFESKLEKLNVICDMFSEIEKLRSRRKIQQFLIDYGTYNDYLRQLEQAYSDISKYDEDIAEFKKKYSELNKQVDRLTAEQLDLVRDKEKYWTDNKGEWLQSEEKRIKTTVEEYEKRITDFITEIKTLSVRWLDKLSNCNKAIDDEEFIMSAEQTKNYLLKTEKFSENDFELLSPEFFGRIRESYIDAKEKLKPVLSSLTGEINELYIKSEELKKQIDSLKRGIKPYPKKAERLKKAISDGLRQKYNKDIPVYFLADLIEITDEQWHNAVEGYLNTQRMNIIVPMQYFMDAYQIYKRARVDGNIHEYAVVDLEKVYEYDSKPMKNSLAEVVKGSDEYVQAYVNYLLGRVICCYSDDKLRDFRTSVTRECMLYHNFSVKSLNSDAYNNPYIGRNSIEKLIENKSKQLNDILQLINEKSQTVKAVNPVVSDEWFLAQNYIDSTVTSMFEIYRDKNVLKDKLAEIQQTIDKIDFNWIGDMDRKIKLKGAEIDAANIEKENTSNSIHDFEREKNKTASEKIPQLKEIIFESEQNISENYSAEYQNETGIARYKSELSECKTPLAVATKFLSPVKATASLIAEKEREFTEKRSEYNSLEQTSFKVSDVLDNSEYEKAFQQIKDYELPKYKEQIEQAKFDAMEQFQSDFLYKLRANIQSAYEKIEDLNQALKMAHFGNDSYKFEIKPNPAYYEYYEMIMSPLLENGNVGLFSYEFTNKYGSVIDNLFTQIVSYDDDPGKTSKNVELFSKYKTYLSFDLLSTDSSGRTDKLSRSIFTKSGGETQTPFYIAVLASFAQLYKVNCNNEYGNTARIVIFDEAFNKMDGERIIQSVNLLRKFGLQAIICSPPEKAADIAPYSDKTLLVYKETQGSVYKSTVIEWKKEMSEIS